MRKPRPSCIRPSANFAGTDGSIRRLSSPAQIIEKTGARMTISAGFTLWKTVAGTCQPKTVRSTLRNVKRLIDEPACSKNAQKMMLKSVSTSTTKSRSRTTFSERSAYTSTMPKPIIENGTST